MDASPCPSDDTLLAFAAGDLHVDEALAVEQHLDGCDDCCAVLAEAGRALVGSRADSADSADTGHRALPAPGERVGRYNLLEVLGRGAMGVVYAAYDPELDRRVAVKLVRFDPRLGTADAELQRRLLLEAQAMARLSHRNVVAVHDIGTFGASVWLAMELVPGATLRAWLAQQPRSWREILEVFLQAGEGLAAAHAAELVHRDFKPDNVLVARDGRVLVTDFGLARVPTRDLADHAPPSSDLRRTRAGAVVGTPAYMAPEQLGGGAVDARADVFAFGASLYEALWGLRAYPGTTLEELAANLQKGVPREPPPSEVPTWVRRAVLRSVAGAPEDRTPSMQTLLHALRADPRRRLRQAAAPLAALAIAALTLGGGWWLSTADARACRAGASRADRLWSPERAGRVEAAFTSANPGYGAETYQRVAQILRSRAAAWQQSREAVCDASHTAGTQSEALLDLRLRCLDDRFAEADALGALFETADEDLLKRAPEAATGLPALDLCDRAEALLSRAPIPVDPAARALAEQGRSLLATAIAAELTGRWDQGQEAGLAALDLASRAGDRTGQAQAGLIVGRTERQKLGLEAAEPRLRAAWLGALAAADDHTAARAALELAIITTGLRRPAPETEAHLAVADAHLTRLGGDAPLRVRLLTARGYLHFADLDADRAVAALREADALAARTPALDSRSRAYMLSTLAAALQLQERYTEALNAHERGLHGVREELGALHPSTLSSMVDFGGTLVAEGRPGEALVLFDEAIAGMSAVYPPDHVDRGTAWILRAYAHAGLGRFDEGLRDADEGIALWERTMGPDFGSLYYGYTIRGILELRAGRAEAALVALDRAAELVTRQLDGDPELLGGVECARAEALEVLGRWQEAEALFRAAEARCRAIEAKSCVSSALDGLGRAALRRGEADAAVSMHREALAIGTGLHAGDTHALAASLHGLGDALLAAGQRPEAASMLRRVVALHERLGTDPIELARARASLARAVAAGPESVALLEQAQAALRQSPYPAAGRVLAQIAATPQGASSAP